MISVKQIYSDINILGFYYLAKRKAKGCFSFKTAKSLLETLQTMNLQEQAYLLAEAVRS